MPIADAPDFVVFEGDDSATTFPFEFLIRSASDIAVYIQDPDLFTETLVDPDEYTVTIDGEDGGEVEYPLVGDPLEEGLNLVLKRSPDFATSLNLTATSGFQPTSTTRQLDNIEMQIQQLRTDADRALKVLHGEEGPLFDADVDKINAAAANAAAAAASAAAAAASAAAADESEAEAEEAAELAVNAAGAGIAGSNTAALLLGTSNGVAVDFVANDFFNRGGSAGLISTTAFGASGFDFDRDTVAYGVDADGFIDQFAADAPVLPSRRSSDGENRGLYITKHPQNLIPYMKDISTAGNWVFTSSTSALVAGELAPDGTETVHRITDTSNSVFGRITYLVPDVAEDLDWFTWFVWVKYDTDSPGTPSSVVAIKSTITGGTPPAATLNIEIDIESGQVIAQLDENEAYVVDYRDGWKLIVGTTQNTELGHTDTNFVFYPDFSGVDGVGSVLVWSPGIIPGKLFTEFRNLEDQPLKPTLTGAKWNTLAGDTTIGTFAAGNLANLDVSHADWVIPGGSVITKSTNAGAGVGGNDAYTLDDTSGVSNSFAQQTHLAAAVSGAQEYANIAWFIHLPNSTGRKIDIRSNFYGGTPVQPVFTFDYDAMTVEISGATTDTGADIVPVDANTILLVAWFQNSADAANVNFRNNIYPAGPTIADQYEIRVSRPFLKITGAPLWTPDALPALEADHVTIDLSDKDFNALAFSVRVDIDDLRSPELGSSAAHHIWSIYDSGGDGMWGLTVQRTDDDPITHSLILKKVDDDGNVMSPVLYEGVELNGASLEVAIKATEITLARDETLLTRVTTGIGSMPSCNTWAIGESSSGVGQPSANFLRAFMQPRYMTVDGMYNAGRWNFSSGSTSGAFSAATKAALRTEAYAERLTLLARVRSGLGTWSSKRYWLGTGEGQSFIRGAWSNTSLLTINSWLAANAANWGDSLMYEGSVRTSASGGTVYTPITDYGGVAGRGPGLNQLAATADAGNDSYTQSELEANFADTTPNTGYAGENPIVAFIHELKRLMLDEAGQTSDASRRLIAATIGTSSDSTLAALAGTDPAQHGEDSNPWLRHKDYMEVVRDYLVNTLFVNPDEIGQLVAKMNHGESMRGVPVTELLDGGTTDTGVGYREWINNIQLRAQEVFGQTNDVLVCSTIPGRLRWADDIMSVAEAMLTLEEERDDFVITNCSLAMQSGGANIEGVRPSSGDHQTSIASIVDGLHAAEAAREILSGRNWFLPRKHRVVQNGKYIYLTVISLENAIEPRKSFITYGTQPEEIFQDGFTFVLGGNKYLLAGDPVYESDPSQPGVTGILFTLASTPSGLVDILSAAKTDSEGASAVYEEAGTFEAPWTYRHNSYDYADREIDDASEGWEVGELLPKRRPLIPFRATCEQYVADV